MKRRLLLAGAALFLTCTLNATVLVGSKTATGSWECVLGSPVFKVIGTITVTNPLTTSVPNLQLVDEIRGISTDGSNTVYTAATQVIGVLNLAPGATASFDYEIYFNPQPGYNYSNFARAGGDIFAIVPFTIPAVRSCNTGGCSFTIGYWKTHAGFTGNNPVG